MNANIIPDVHAAHNTLIIDTEYFARQLFAAGCSFIPLKIDGSKAPPEGLAWKRFQEVPPDESMIAAWFGYKPDIDRKPRRGLAVITGTVSGNLEMIDIDDASIVRKFFDLVKRRAPHLMRRLVGVKSPRPGCQLFYRCAEIGRNQVLAAHEILASPSQIATADAYPNQKGDLVVKRARIETRGQGGYAVAVGSSIDVHRNKIEYQFFQHDYSLIPEISTSEREILFDVARSFSSIQGAPSRMKRERKQYKPGDILTCVDDYNARADVNELLTIRGWTYVRASRFGSQWRRPGKDDGVSASLYENGLFHVFTSSTEFEQNHTYTPFEVFAILHCGSDFKRAAQTLGVLGYGGRKVK